MKGINLRLAVLLCMVAALGVEAKDKFKPWTEWSKKDAQKILDYSPWGQTQVLTDNSKIGFTPSTALGDVTNAARLNYRISLISAKPIRLAFLRLAQLDKLATPEQVRQMQSFVDMKFDDMIVLAVSFDSEQSRVIGAALRSFNSGVTSMLAQTTYLSVNRRPRNYLKEYQPPAADGLGAKFIFARMVDGKPYLDPKSGSLQFYAKFPQLAGNDAPVELDWRFNAAEMTYDGIFEY